MTKILINKSFSGLGISELSQKLNPYIENRKTASYLALILSFFTLSFFGIFAIKPTLSKVTLLNKEIADARNVNSKLEDKINNLVQAQAEFEKIREDLPLVYQSLPRSPEVAKLAVTLEKIATNSALPLETVQFDPVTLSPDPKNTKLTNYGFITGVRGSYQNILDFLTHLDNIQRLVTTSEINMEKVTESSQSSTLKVTVRGKTYYEQ